MKLKQLFFFLLISIMFILPACNSSNTEELIATSTSPDKTYTVEAYKDLGNATVDFSVRVYIVNDGRKDLIYNKYHEYKAEISWVDDNTITINGIDLNLSKNETYDWRDN